ncbi:MAG TPA: hypothetical protein VGO47_02005 [Chlamydiales bacterium]|nr:hypothetical protein [Chlamydiales bacterium]
MRGAPPLEPGSTGPVDKGKGVERPTARRTLPPQVEENRDDDPENALSEVPLEVRSSQVQEWTEGVIPPRAESPEELVQAITRSRATVHDPTSSNLDQVGDKLVAFIRPKLMSNADSVTTILSTHSSLLKEAEYWGNMTHKCYERHRYAYELWAITTEKVVQELWANQAPTEALEQSALVA